MACVQANISEEVFDEASGDLVTIIETPQGSRNKFEYDEQHGLFKLSGVLPAGASFPFDFGFVPSTQGEDGDPLDVLVLMDEPTFVGCLVHVRLIGVVEADQSEAEGTVKNNRLIGVASASRNHSHVHTLDDLNANVLDEIEHFFISYNAIKDKAFTPTARSGPEAARSLIQQGILCKQQATPQKNAKQ